MNITADAVAAFIASGVVCLLTAGGSYTLGLITGRDRQRKIEDTATLVPYEWHGKQYFIRLYDWREANIEGKERGDETY